MRKIIWVLIVGLVWLFIPRHVYAHGFEFAVRNVILPLATVTGGVVAILLKLLFLKHYGKISYSFAKSVVTVIWEIILIRIFFYVLFEVSDDETNLVLFIAGPVLYYVLTIFPYFFLLKEKGQTLKETLSRKTIPALCLTSICLLSFFVTPTVIMLIGAVTGHACDWVRG